MPIDIESTSMPELLADCREVSDVLEVRQIDLTTVPPQATTDAVAIPSSAAAALEGYGEYGS